MISCQAGAVGFKVKYKEEAGRGMRARKVANGETAAEAKGARAVPQQKSALREYAEALIVAVLLALVIRTFVVQAFKIPSGSMIPTLDVGDHILVSKFIYDFTTPKRGDVIVFKYPQDESRDFIKRVVGLPGDTLEIRGRQLLINEKPLSEPYARFVDGPKGPMEQEHFGPIVIPPHKLFMMGDNRDRSMDSRVWGLLDEGKVEGEAFVVYFSIRSEDIPSVSLVPGLVYVVGHPSLIRWSRIGHLIQ
jgi:signal peptidase I